MTRFRRPAQKDGYILISVLVITALLSGLVGALLYLARSATDTASVGSQDLRRETLVQSAVALAGYQLFVLKRPQGDVDGQHLRLDAGVVTLTVTSDAGKVDLNGSGKDLLAAAYRASGLTGMPPDSFAARVIDWRDGDDDPSTGGAEASAYETLGFRPRNGPFRSLEDLRFVLGVVPADVERLRPLLTIFNAGGRLSAFLAPESLIAAIPGMTSSTVKTLKALRVARTAESVKKIDDLLLVQASLIDTSTPKTYRIGISVQATGEMRRHEAAVTLSAGATAESPYQVLSWTAEP